MPLTALAEPAAGAAYATDWVDASFDVPAGASEVGLSVASSFQNCGYGIPNAVRGIVTDGIELE
jgi:hypothetical protein